MNVSTRFCALAAALLSASPLAAEVILLQTSDHPLEGTTWNQGWWSNNVSNPNTANSSPAIGTLDSFGVPNGNHRNFYTFLLPPAVAGKPVVAATLLQHRGVSLSTNEVEETIGFFDVQTPYDVLNHNVGSSASIYNDLGSGVSFGQFVVPGTGSGDTLLEFPLNAAAVATINAAAGTYFSVGGSLISNNGNDALFGGQVHGPGALRLVTVPEPATLCLTATGIWTALAYWRRCRESPSAA
jgi:hypothetical protein